LPHLVGKMNDLLRIVSTCSSEDRDAPSRLVHQDLDDADALGERERGILARRPARHEEVDARVNLAPAEPADGGFVDAAGFRERRHKRRADSCPVGSHWLTPKTSCIVNQPCCPLTQRAACRAPRANAVRSRAVWVSVIDSAGPSKPIVCVPGMWPARVEDTSIGLE